MQKQPTIALISHASKILLHILNERLRQHHDRELPPEQAGFRRGRGTRDHIANIRQITGKCNKYQRKVYLCFIDYSKALTVSAIESYGKRCFHLEFQLIWWS